MIYPVDPKFPITQRYGENPDWYPLTHGHNGLDLGLPEGNPVKAVFPGLATFAGLDPETSVNPKSGYGNYVRIQGANFLVIFGHLMQINVKRDDQVNAGQVVGLSGGNPANPQCLPTGFSTGPHLHFELRTGSSLATCTDPFPLLSQDEKPDRKPLFYAQLAPGITGVVIRLGPSLISAKTGLLTPGDANAIPVYAIAGAEAWIEHDRGFSAFRFGGGALLQAKP